MNEDLDYDYDKYFDYHEKLEKKQVLDRYSKGYLKEEYKSPLREDVLKHGAKADLDVFLEGVDEEGYDRGYSNGRADAEDELQEDLRALEGTVDRLSELLERHDEKRLAKLEEENISMRKLRDEALAEKRNILAELSLFLGTIMDTSPTPTDDVEAWAFQDGTNQTVMQVQEWIMKIKAAREFVEGESGPNLKKLPEQDVKSFRDPYSDDDEDDWPPF